MKIIPTIIQVVALGFVLNSFAQKDSCIIKVAVVSSDGLSAISKAKLCVISDSNDSICVYTDKNGKCEVNVPYGNFRISCEARLYMYWQETFLVMDSAVIHKNITLDKMLIHEPVFISNIYFEKNESMLNESQLEALKKLIYLLKNNPEIKIIVEGNSYQESSIKTLSLKRAAVVKDYLVNAGILESRILVRRNSLQNMLYREMRCVTFEVQE